MAGRGGGCVVVQGEVCVSEKTGTGQGEYGGPVCIYWDEFGFLGHGKRAGEKRQRPKKLECLLMSCGSIVETQVARRRGVSGVRVRVRDGARARVGVGVRVEVGVNRIRIACTCVYPYERRHRNKIRQTKPTCGLFCVG